MYIFSGQKSVLAGEGISLTKNERERNILVASLPGDSPLLPPSLVTNRSASDDTINSTMLITGITR